MKTSDQGILLIKTFEGCETQSYQCSADVWTVGYGHTKGVKKGDIISEADAEELLRKDLLEFEGYVKNLVKVDLNQNQFDSLVSWTFNLGPSNLTESTLLRLLNEGDYDAVPDQIRRWNRSGGKVLEGLKRRREAEALMWLGFQWKNV